MKKQFVSSFNYIKNPTNDSFISYPFFLNNVDNFNFCQLGIFRRKNNQLSDYDETNEQENDSPCTPAKNSISNNIFSFENEPIKTISNVIIENVKNKGEVISKKTKEIFNFSEEINDKENKDKLNTLKTKEYSLVNDKNISKNSNNIEILVEPVIEIGIYDEENENIIDSSIINKNPKNAQIDFQSIEIAYEKEFQLFTKGTKNSYINEIINSINNTKKTIKKRTKKLFNIYTIENEDTFRLVGRKRKNRIKQRYEKPDDIRKKLKSRFHKIFTQKINDNLFAANSEKEFYLLPQIFVSNISKKQNKEVMNMKMKDLFRKNFVEDYKKYKLKNIEASNEKYLKNLNTLKYLDRNIDIKEKSKFNIIGEMKYFEILDEFFYSKEFEDTVISESEKKPFEYVKDYVKKARTYTKFFLFSN